MMLLKSLFLAATAAATVSFGGVNIAGFDFGCDVWGNCNGGLDETMVTTGAGLTQMTHFVSKGLNAFRLPVRWQYLAQSGSPGVLDEGNWLMYDQLVQMCTKAGASMCIVDMYVFPPFPLPCSFTDPVDSHNYARWNGGIIGQGGPTNAQFAAMWSSLASKYGNDSRVAFGLMNEPHDLDVYAWAQSAQAAVTAIRNAGANNTILLPGTDYTSLGAFQYNSAPAMATVTNPGGGTDNIVRCPPSPFACADSGRCTTCTTTSTPPAPAPPPSARRTRARRSTPSPPISAPPGARS
jgi:endoglucanase